MLSNSKLDWQLLHERRLPIFLVQHDGSTTLRRIVLLADQYVIPALGRHYVVAACASNINQYVSNYHFDVLVFGATNYLATEVLLARTAHRVLGRPPCSLLALMAPDVYMRPAVNIR